MVKLAGTSSKLPAGKSWKPVDSLSATQSRQQIFFNFLLIPFSPVTYIQNVQFKQEFFLAVEK